MNRAVTTDRDRRVLASARGAVRKARVRRAARHVAVALGTLAFLAVLGLLLMAGLNAGGGG